MLFKVVEDGVAESLPESGTRAFGPPRRIARLTGFERFQAAITIVQF
jgi:hypothetical protein